MPISIENYTPQTIIARQKRQSLWVWSVTFAVVLLWIFSILAAPLAARYGYDHFAASVYSFFGHICHQISARSFHIGDEQFAVCARCFGFYSGFLTGIGIYPLFRSLDDTNSFPRFWLFAAMIPIGVDFSLTFFSVWENTHLSRLITGGILGIACAFFIIPALVEIAFVVQEKMRRR